MTPATSTTVAADTGMGRQRVPGDAADFGSHDHGHAVSWAAIFAGAAAAAALSLILLVLGVGLGLTSMSPWAARGVDASTAGIGSIFWLMVVATAASGLGGYLAGRLRARWAGAHIDEVYFRDTAHGFLAWAIATLVTAGLLGSAIAAILGAGAQAGASALGGAATAATGVAAGAAAGAGKGDGNAMMGYFTDSLYRGSAVSPSAPASSASAGTTQGSDASDSAAVGNGAQAGRIFARAMSTGSMAADDVRYLGQQVAQRTGLSQQDAERRVNDTYAKARQAVQDAEAKAKQAADEARKAAAYAALWIFVSLLLGAFVASFMATFGGRRRDL